MWSRPPRFQVIPGLVTAAKRTTFFGPPLRGLVLAIAVQLYRHRVDIPLIHPRNLNFNVNIHQLTSTQHSTISNPPRQRYATHHHHELDHSPTALPSQPTPPHSTQPSTRRVHRTPPPPNWSKPTPPAPTSPAHPPPPHQHQQPQPPSSCPPRSSSASVRSPCPPPTTLYPPH